MRLLLPALVCFSLLAFAPAAFADPAPPASSLRSDILYTHKGEFVQVKPMRPLTLNAHVTQFAYDPLGIEIAYVGSTHEGDTTSYFAKTVDTRTGHEISRLAYSQEGQVLGGFLLLGFSATGKYLLLKKCTTDSSTGEPVLEFLRWDLSTSPTTTKTINPQAALPQEQQSADLEGSADCFPSPNGRWLVFTQSIHTQQDNGKPGPDKNAYVLYDPERDTFKLLALPPKTPFDAWADNSHLKIWQDGVRKQFDVVTGQISPRSEDTKPNLPAVSKQYPDLSLDTQNPKQQDAKGGDGYMNSYIIWIHRTPFGKTPFGAAAAGLMPRPEVAPGWGSDDPQAVWSPTGKQVAFLANDDLYVTDLVAASGAMPREKLAAGLPLDCADERVLAITDLKQIGLALIQYAQDNDEHYPPTANIEQALAPYLDKTDVFSVGSTRWVYQGDSNASLASIESPADTVQATIDLPCARIVLFFDGHVKAFPKEPTP